MNKISFTISLIGSGLLLGTGLVIYAHANFSTKETVNIIKDNQEKRESLIIKKLDQIDRKIDKILYK